MCSSCKIPKRKEKTKKIKKVLASCEFSWKLASIAINLDTLESYNKFISILTMLWPTFFFTIFFLPDLPVLCVTERWTTIFYPFTANSNGVNIRTFSHSTSKTKTQTTKYFFPESHCETKKKIWSMKLQMNIQISTATATETVTVLYQY